MSAIIESEYTLRACFERPDLQPHDRLELALAVLAALRGAIPRDHHEHYLSPGAFTIAGERGAYTAALRKSTQDPRASFRLEALQASVLPYMAPEQTGRVSAREDERADFYAMGVVCFELFCGQLPFNASDRMGWVHAHIAQRPAALLPLAPWGGPALEAVVMRLLAKSPDARYQSVAGIERDLERILAHIEHGDVPDFEIGQDDVSRRLRLPQRLFGRQSAQELARAQWARACAGEHTLLCVAGRAGAGKTALGLDVRQHVVAQRGYVVMATCERAQRARPYKALLEGFERLLRQILTESEQRLSLWRERFSQALGANVGVLLDVLPALKWFVDVPEVAPALLGVAERQNRFVLLFTKFVAALCSAQHPLAIVLDDAHWADRSTLSLLTHILQDADMAHLMLAMTYQRGVDGEHPLHDFISAHQGPAMASLELEPLQEQDIAQLLHAMLGEAHPDVPELATLCKRKTGGKPLMLRRLLREAMGQGLFTWTPMAASWTWSMDAVQALEVGEGALDLFLESFEALDASAREAVQVAACLGIQFDASLLVSCLDTDISGVLRALEDAVGCGLIHWEAGQHEEGRFIGNFQHERVRQAALETIAPAHRQALHLKLGEALSVMHQREDAGLSFEIAEQWREVIELLTPEQRASFARFSFDAARQARGAIAYGVALRCLQDAWRALSHEQGDAWTSHPDMAAAIARDEAECFYLLGEFARAEARFDEAHAHARTPLERASLTRGHVELLAHLGRHEEAVQKGVAGLELLGCKMHGDPGTAGVVKELAAVRFALGRREPAQLLELDEMTDPIQLATMRLIYTLTASANFVRKNLFPLLSLRMTLISLRHGNMELSSLAYCCFGMIMSAVLGKRQLGAQLGEMALTLSDRYVETVLGARARTRFLYGGIIGPWVMPVDQCIECLEEMIQEGLACGEFLYSAFCVTLLADMLIFSGRGLDGALTRCAELDVILERARDEDSMDMARAGFQAMHALRGDTESLASMSSSSYDEQERVGVMQGMDNQNPYFFSMLYKMQLLLLDGRVLDALAIAQATRTPPEGTLGLLAPLEHLFWDGIICGLASDEPISARQRHSCTKRLSMAARKLEAAARLVPENFQARGVLLRAMQAHVLQNSLEALELFDHAAKLAAQHSMPNIEALSNHLAALHHEREERALIARAYRQRAVACWRKLGALAVARRWELARAGRPGASAQSLDMTTMLTASQALSSEIRHDRLLERIIALAMENMGATRALVLFNHEQDGLMVDAVGHGRDDVDASLRVPLRDFEELVRTAVNFCARTQETLLIEDVRASDFARDPWVQRSGVRSLLCLPVSLRGRLKGLIYLENTLTPGAFTPARQQLLAALGGQLAISLENAQVYGELEARVRERTRALERANQELLHEVEERQRAQAQAIEASRSKSLFLANMSHELRTPLNAIIGYSGLIVEEMQDAGIQEFLPDLNRVDVSARHLLGLINDILDLSKIEARKMEVVLELVDLETFIREMASTASGLFTKNENHFEVIPAQGELEADRVKLGQVVLNLLSNAAKFTTQGRVTLRASQHVDARGKQWVHFDVQDSGIGITKAQQANLFQAFSQATHSTSAKYGGTGLGLALSRELCLLMGGDIHLSSAPGKGSTFSVRLPMRQPKV